MKRPDEMAGEILSMVRRDGLKPGTRLIEQRLADALGVSRGPVRSGLRALEAVGLIEKREGRGFVLADGASSRAARKVLATLEDNERPYRAIAYDRLDGSLPDTVTEAELMRRYELGRPELLRLLDRIATEGWVARLPGYGWRFAETLATPAAYLKAAAFRAVIEPAALAVPGYALAQKVADRLRQQQLHMLDNGLATLTIGEIFVSGCEFHEGIAKGAPNPFFADALRRLNAIRRLFAYRTFEDEAGMRRHVLEHLKLLDLIEARRLDEAATLLKRHIEKPPRIG